MSRPPARRDSGTEGLLPWILELVNAALKPALMGLSRAAAALLSGAALCASAAAAPGPCDANIPGDWTGFFPGPLDDLYEFTWADRPARNWSAFNPNRRLRWPAAAPPPPLRWDRATGVFSADWTTTTSFIDDGGNMNGNVSADCTAIVWDNGSVWKPRPPPTPVVVHLAPHTHDDVGWDESYLEYYYGNGTSNGPQGYYNVSRILSTVVAGLLQDSRRRYSYVEQAYLSVH